MADERGLDCNQVVELVTAYLEGTLESGTAAAVELHLAGCEGCDIYLEQMRATIGTLGALPSETVSDDARTALLNAFRAYPRD